MAATKFIVEYYIAWNDGTNSHGTRRFRIKSLKKLFDRFYDKIIIGQISDEELYEPDMINEVSLRIMRNPVPD